MIKNHLFPVEAFFESSIVLTFAVPQKLFSQLIPPCLTLDTYQEKWAFIAVAMVQTTGLRPKGFPSFFGNNFFLIGYRLFVNFKNKAGKKFRGLYILKSETDSLRMEILGNFFTHYNYERKDFKQYSNGHQKTISSKDNGFIVEADLQPESQKLPPSSPFDDWKTARKYAGPLPFTFNYNPKNKKVLVIQGVRQNWTPRPIQITNYHIPFINQLHLEGIVLANAFIIEKVPYHWKKGKFELWQ